MPDCKFTKLDARGLIKVTGEDAHKFLQDIVTNDVNKAVDGKAVHAALLAPQGKILFDFFLLNRGDHFLLECGEASTQDLIKRLTFYKLRAAVEMEYLSADYCVWAAWGGEPALPEDAIQYDDPRLAALGQRIICTAEVALSQDGCEAVDIDAYHAHRISLGVPDSGLDYPLGETFPHEADYDALGTVDFKKGCYVGQEVVGRMKHRGTARKRIVPVHGSATLSPGVEVIAGDTSIGTVGSVSGASGLATLRLDRAEKAIEEGQKLMAGDVEIELGKPEWADFDVPVAGAAG